MNKKDVFEAWAPSGARWSGWVKPVLFATLSESNMLDREAEPDIELELSPALTAPGVALVVDLPGEDSVLVGLALAKRGIRPVPLFNALPGFERSLVDVDGIQRALVASAKLLRSFSVAADAPPAFLLDALRRVARYQRRTAEPPRERWAWERWEKVERWRERYFDNRSVSFSTDFPSGDTLRAQGIVRVVLLRRWYLVVPGDLVATLAAWHRVGLAIEIHDVESERSPKAWIPPRLLWLRRLWFYVLVPLLLKRDKSGAFGGLLPPASAG